MVVRFSLSVAVSLILGCGSVVATPATTAKPAPGLPPIRSVAQPRFFGAALNSTFLFNDPVYTKLAQTQFSIFTPENEMKWEVIHPFPNVYNFTPADELVQFAHKVNAKVRGHNFVWGSQLAPWVNDSLTAFEIDNVLKEHITTIMDHYKKDNIYAWDIVNEIVSDTLNVSTFKQILWTQKLGEDVVPKAFTYARAANPKVKLYINDYGIEAINPKSDALFNIVQGMIKDKIPIDGVGFQCHLGLGQVPATLQQNLQRFADLGLDVAITELDINTGSLNPTDAMFQQQASDYFAVVNACANVKRCVSVTTWGIMDNHSWIVGKEVLPWTGTGEAKPAATAIVQAFQAAK